MNSSSLVAVWILFLICIFCIGYTVTSIFVTAVMADFRVEGTGYTSLEVTDNFGTQTDNHYQVQPAINVAGLEL